MQKSFLRHQKEGKGSFDLTTFLYRKIRLETRSDFDYKAVFLRPFV
jgi:hypothetical protein